MDLPAEFGIFPNRGGRGGLLEEKISSSKSALSYEIPKFGVLNLDFIPPKKNNLLSLLFSIGQ